MFSFLTVAWIRETDSLNFFFREKRTCNMQIIVFITKDLLMQSEDLREGSADEEEFLPSRIWRKI